MKRVLLILFGIIFACFGCLSACSSNDASYPSFSGQVKLMVSGDHITVIGGDGWITRGLSADVTIQIDDGYEYSGTDYEDATVSAAEQGYILHLPNVQYNTSVSVYVSLVEEQKNIIYYDTNGGGGQSFYKEYDCSLRTRPNTPNADTFQREGYTLTSWNTEADGSGERVGLGSRFTLQGSDTLYAQWEQWSDASLFEYETVDDGVWLKKYLGQEGTVVIPEYIQGLAVVGLRSGCFTDCAAQRIVLPRFLSAVEKGAFQSCEMECVDMFDSVLKIYDESFADCPNFSTLRLLSATAPRYTDLEKNNHYVDKIDLLILKEDRPRAVCMAGSSIWYNLNGYTLESDLQKKYQIVNLGFNGFYSGIVQFEIMEAFLQEGDVVIHAPEECSEEQLMVSRSMDVSMFNCLESNYDLFSLVDIRHLTEVFSSFSAYNIIRMKQEEKSYDDFPAVWWLDEYGGIQLVFSDPQYGANLADSADICPELLTEENFKYLNGYYQNIKSITGNRVLVTYSAINYNGLPEDCTREVWEEYEQEFGELLDSDAAVLFGNLEDNIYPSNYFYLSNFHLSTQGKNEWSYLFADNVKKAFRAEGLL